MSNVFGKTKKSKKKAKQAEGLFADIFDSPDALAPAVASSSPLDLTPPLLVPNPPMSTPPPSPTPTSTSVPPVVGGGAVPGLPAAVTALLAEINGQDCYDAKVAAVGKLSRDHYLRLPQGFHPTLVDNSRVGTRNAVANLTDDIYCQIYALNKPIFENGDAQVKGALLRAELVSAGWVEGYYEVMHVAPLPAAEVQATMVADLDKIKEFAGDAKVLALLLPLAAEHTFRTMGHHYLTALSADYTVKYSKYFSACVAPHLANYLPPELLYHRVAHWVSLTKALAVSRDADQVPRLPNAVVLRATAGPAGTAVITTSDAILKALAQTGLKAALVEASGADVAKLEAMSETVKGDPGKYHTIPTAYGGNALSDRDKKDLDDVKEIAYMLAPVLQGFLDSLPRNADLPQAKALVKHADVNPLLRKRAKLFFKEVGTTKAGNMKELFAGDKRGLDVVGNTDKVSADALADEED